MNKLISLIGGITITMTSTVGVVACSNIVTDNGNIETEENKIRLSQDINTTNIGRIKNSYPETIMSRIKALNPNLRENETYIETISSEKAMLTVKTGSTRYVEEFPGVEIYFKVQSSIDLKDVISTTYIEEIAFLNEESILTNLLEYNPEIELDYVFVPPDSISYDKALISPKNHIHITKIVSE